MAGISVFSGSGGILSPDKETELPLGDRAISQSPRHLRFLIASDRPFDAPPKLCSQGPGLLESVVSQTTSGEYHDWQSQPLILQCARHWQYINEVGYRAVKDIAVVMYYEDHVSDPHHFARTVCDKAGIIASDHAEAIEAWATTVGNSKSPDSYEAKRQVHWFRQDHATRVERWRENLSLADTTMIWPIIEAAASMHGYGDPRPGEHRTFSLLG